MDTESSTEDTGVTPDPSGGKESRRAFFRKLSSLCRVRGVLNTYFLVVPCVSARPFLVGLPCPSCLRGQLSPVQESPGAHDPVLLFPNANLTQPYYRSLNKPRNSIFFLC